MKKHILRSLLAVGFVGLASAAFASGEGTAVGVKPDAVSRAGSQDRLLEVGTDISVGELIVTGPVGQVQIIFDDNTKLVVGPGSSLLIETYLLASNNTAQKLAINALGGSFRFITGNSPKPAYSIHTPTAAIAVRGTEFDLIVAPQATRVMLYKGALQICNNSGACAEISDRCEIGEASSENAILYERNDPNRPPLSEEFRYARVQAQLLSQFRVSGVSSCVGETSDPGVPQSLSTMTGSPLDDDGRTQTPGPQPVP